MSDVPHYITERIRAAAPASTPIIRGSTPVIAFGDLRAAWAATLGLNPSKVEFLGRTGEMLSEEKQRLETLESLECPELTAARDSVVERVFAGCNTYFNRRPYKWFNKLERVLNRAGASYFNGTACHLDLVQWATDPVWGKLNRKTLETLLKADLPFLQKQLSHEHIRLVLLNGRQIVRECEKRLLIPLKELSEHQRGRVKFFAGRKDSGLVCVGWNINLQSSFGVKGEEIDAISEVVNSIINTSHRLK